VAQEHENVSTGRLGQHEERPIVDWRHATAAEHAAVLLELLELVDRLPPRPRGALRFPRLAARVDG
jgi:hypothetical protein